MELKNELTPVRTDSSVDESRILAYLLGKALRYDNQVKFLEVYDGIPHEFPQHLVIDIKEEARRISELSDDDFNRLSQELNCRPDNKDIHISPNMSDSEFMNGPLTLEDVSRTSLISKDTENPSNKVSDIINNNAVPKSVSSASYLDSKLPSPSCESGKQEEMISASVSVSQLRKDSQSSLEKYESCDENAPAEKTSKAKKKRKKNKGKRTNNCSPNMAATVSEHDKLNQDASLANEESSSVVSAASVDNNSEITGGSESKSKSEAPQCTTKNPDIASSSSPLSINHISPPPVATSLGTSPESDILRSESTVPEQSANHNSESSNTDENGTYSVIPSGDTNARVPSIPRLLHNDSTQSKLTAVDVSLYDFEAFEDVEEFREVKRKTRPGSKNSTPNGHPVPNNHRKSNMKSANNALLPNGVTQTNNPGLHNAPQLIPSLGANSAESNHHSYANRLKSSLNPPPTSAPANTCTTNYPLNNSAYSSRNSTGRGSARNFAGKSNQESINDSPKISNRNVSSKAHAVKSSPTPEDKAPVGKSFGVDSEACVKNAGSPICKSQRFGVQSESLKLHCVESRPIKSTIDGVNNKLSFQFEEKIELLTTDALSNEVNNSNLPPFNCAEQASDNSLTILSSNSSSTLYKDAKESKVNLSDPSKSSSFKGKTETKSPINPIPNSLSQTSSSQPAQSLDFGIRSAGKEPESCSGLKQDSRSGFAVAQTAESLPEDPEKLMTTLRVSESAPIVGKLGRSDKKRAVKMNQLQFGNFDISSIEGKAVGEFDLFEATAYLAKNWEVWNRRVTKNTEWFSSETSTTISTPVRHSSTSLCK